MVVQDGWSSCKEVTLEDMASDEQYDPDTVYGTANTFVFSQLLKKPRKNIEFACESFFYTHMRNLKSLSSLVYHRVQLFCSGSGFYLQTLQQLLPL